jgi:hypothetical protein
MDISDRDLMRIALRLPESHVRVYQAVARERKRQSDVAADFGMSKQRIHSMVRRMREVVDGPPPSAALRRGLPVIEAEACAMAGYSTIREVCAAITDNAIPNWWPAPVVAALCQRFALPVPEKAAKRVAQYLLEKGALP